MSDSTRDARALFENGGEMGRLMASMDWSRTPLGPVERWSQSLKTSVRILLSSRFEMWMAWGPQLPFLYNDAYLRKTIGKKHPRALGTPTRELWSEIWGDIGPRIEHVLKTGQATWDEALLLFLERSGYTEETYHTFSYSPLSDDDGSIAGMLSVVTEETERVIGERRLRTLRDLASELAAATGEERIFGAVARALGANGKDLPFTLVYLFEDEGRRARLVCATRIEAGHRAAPAAFALDGASTPWPSAQVHAGVTLRVEGLQGLFGALPTGDWTRPPERALLVPFAQSGSSRPAGFLVAALNPFRALDEAYEGFVGLVAGQIAASLSNARAYEQERRRAEALAELDRAKTSFFSNVSHEFRTPLTLMLGPIEDALGSPGRALAGRDLDTAHRNALRLLRLVNALLDFSRIEAGRVEARYRPSDLAALTAELASQFRSAIERGGLRLVVRCEPLGEPVYVDVEMWEKVVLNLLSNAFKYTHQGEIEVALERAGDEVVLLVRDTGIGVPADELPRLFERFHRVEGARGRTHEGSGIGLALVQELVRMHGGRIEAASEVGRGTQFRVFLRTGRAHLPPEKLREAPPAERSASRSTVFVEEALHWASDAGSLAGSMQPEAADPGVRILLAEDNADMRDYLTRLLQASWTVTAVADGEAALEAIREQAPALVITDVMMPRLDGFGLLRALREAPDTRGIPVLMLSARAGEEARIEGLDAGADDYIVKPFSAREFVARVAANLKLSRMRERLRSEQAAMAALFQQSPMPIAVLRGQDLVFELANQPYLAIASGGRDLVGLPLLKALPELEGQGYDRLLHEVMRTGQPYVGREMKVLLRRNGRSEETYWTFIYAPLRGLVGENEAVVVMANEVTEQVQARERQDRLIREAAQASRAKDEFLAMLGHELRNPLSPIVTALQLLRLRGEQGSEHEIIERQVGHLTRLVDDLLDVSRITQGKIALRRRRLEMAEVVARAVETASPLLEQRQSRLDVRVPSRGLEVDADPDRLAQVLSNLLTNAAKYSDENSRIEVFGAREGDTVRIRVRDHGAGIAPEMLERIWDLFVQQPQTVERSVGGLGLGLTIVRSLVRLHGGQVSASSAGLGKGSEFTVELPAAAPQAAAVAAPAGAGAAAARQAARRVLVVDDNRDAAMTLAMMLSHLGHTVKVAHDGPSALEAARHFQAEVALLDIGLPVMDGYELARRLREQDQRDVRLVAITGYGQDADRRRSFDAGFAVHLVKPVDLSALVGALAEPM